MKVYSEIQEKSNQKNSCLKCGESYSGSGDRVKRLFCKINKKECEIARVGAYGCVEGRVGSRAVYTQGSEGGFTPSLTDRDVDPLCPAVEAHDEEARKADDGELLEGVKDLFPSLDKNGQSGTLKDVKAPWSRQQKRIYRNLLSWMTLKRGQGFQLLRVDLTSIFGGGKHLTVNFKKLRRIVESTFGYRIEYFKIVTNEGNGVLHMVWAIKHVNAVFIPQKWLSRTWKDISGAYIVHISRLGASRGKTGKRYPKKTMKENIKKVAGYLVAQYMTNQDALVRASWSWWRNGLCLVKAWKQFCGLCQRGIYLPGQALDCSNLKKWELFKGWGELLEFGWWSYGSKVFTIEGGEVVMSYIKLLRG